MTRQREQVSGSPVPFALALGAAAVGVAVWPVWRMPGLPVTLVALTVAGMTHRPPVLTGGTARKRTLANDSERRAVERHRRARLLRWVIVPRGLWPVQTAVLAAVGLACCLLGLPVRPGLGWVTSWGPCLQAASALLLGLGLERWWRVAASPDEPGPGTPLVMLGRVGRWGLATVAAMAVVGAIVGASTFRALGAPPALWVAGCGLVGAAAGIWALCRRASWRPWRRRRRAREAWAPRWAALPRQDPPPVLTAVDEVGPYTVETFMCPAGHSPQEYFRLAETLGSLVGAGSLVRVFAAPADGGGTVVHPAAFRVCTISPDSQVEFDKLDAEAVEIACACALADAGSPQVIASVSQRLTCESTPNVWRVQTVTSQAGDMVPDAVPALTTLAPVLVDGQSLILGDTAGAHWADPEVGEHVAELALGADWETHFREVLRPSQTPPVAQVRYLDTQTVASTDVRRLPFASPQGQDVAAVYLGLGQRLRTTMPSAPFLTVLGMPPTEGQAAPGARSDKFFAVVWSTEPVPESPAELPPSAMPSRSPFDGRDGATLVLAGLIDGAFRAVFAAKTAPELVEAQCLTRGGPYIWRATLRLYGGLSVADVRRRADRLAAILRAEWLRVRPAGDLVDLYVGAHPSKASPTHGSMRVLAELDFEQAFVDAGLVTPAGETPTLEDLTALEGNPDVQVHDLALPSGLSVREVTDKHDRLAASTGRDFLRILPGEGPSQMRVLAAARNPIPDAASYDAAATMRLITDSGRGGRLRMPWGVGLDGAPVTWDIGTTPHCLVLGPTGTGKTVLLTDALTGALLASWETLVIDPVKGGADFTALGPFLRGLIGTVDEAAQCLQAVYQQVLARKDHLAESGAASIDALPTDLRPPHMLIVIDEFTSLLLPEKVQRTRTSDPDVLAERAETERLNGAKATIASLVGKLGREARSAGVHILLGAQALRAQTLAAIPGNDLKTNTGRLLLGVASYGDLASALRRPEQAPVLTYAPPGRGVWESLNGVAVEVQGWYTPPSDLAAMLRDQGVAEREDWSLGTTDGALPTATTAYSELPPDETQEPVELNPLDLGDLGLDDLALE